METPEKGDEGTLPLLTPKTAGGSQRVIKQIMVIDPNKLRMAGLDVKMAEALKKAKKKSQPKSKESKLAAAKSILNKKLKEALSKKGLAGATSSPLSPSISVLSVEEAAKKLSCSEKTKSVKTKPKISVATLKSLMPPPSFPVSSLISPNQTVAIKVLKSEKTKQSIEVKIVDSVGETPQKIDTFPKASLKTQREPKIVKTQTLTPEMKFELREKSSISENPDELGVPIQDSGETSQTVIVHVEDKKKTQNPRKGSLKERDTSGSIHSISLSNAVETSKNKSSEIVHCEPSPNEDKSVYENTNPIANQVESLVAEAESSIEMAPLMPVHVESLPNVSDSSLKIISSTPIRRETLPKVIESKVLSPGEKIDLSILTKKSPTALTVPKKRYKLDHNWITSESNQEESVYINLSPVPKPTPPKPVVQESAVDFINNLSLFFAESQKNKSPTKNVSQILTKECGEDATSFLVSLFQKKQDTSPKNQTKPLEKNEDSKAAPVKAHCKTNDVQIEQKIFRQETSSEKSSNTINTQELDKNNSPNKENKTNKNLQLVRSVNETTIDASQSSAMLLSEETSIQENKSMISKSDKDKISIEHVEPVEASIDLTKTVSNANLILPEVDRGFSDISVSLTSESSSINESLQESVSKSSTPPVSSRRKASKPIPVLIPKLRKSRKPISIAQDQPENIIPQKSTKKPEEESPTQPVQNKEAFNVFIPGESTPCQTEVEKEEISDKNTQQATNKTEQKDTSLIPSLASQVSAEIVDELPTTSKKERPQRQRKISLKLLESSEFEGVVNRTVEQMIKKNKESTTPTERPQRQRKVSFKLLESAESLPTTVKPPIQDLVNSNEQEIKEKIDPAPKTERPQRQRRITLKLLESSEPLSTMKSLSLNFEQQQQQLVQVKNRSVEPENKEKLKMATATEKSHCTRKSKDNTNLDSLIAIEMGNDAIRDPIAQLVAFHETVEKFEIACGSLKSTKIQNTTSSLEEECSSITKYPFYDAICSDMSVENVQTNQPTEGKENVSGEQLSTKILRKRKDSLKSRKFAGEQISIVCSDSLDISGHTPKNITQTRKIKETPTIRQSESEEVPEVLEFTPKLTETKSFDRTLVSEVVQNKEKFSLDSTEIDNNSRVKENSDATACSLETPQSTNTETPTNTSGKKRRGRPPKVRKQFPKPRVLEIAAEVSQPTTANSYNEPTKTVSCKSTNLRASWETIPSTDEQYTQEVTQLKEIEKAVEVSTETTESSSIIKSKTTLTRKNSNIGGSWETLPSADEHLNQEVTICDKSGSKSVKKRTGKSRIKSYSLKSKGQERSQDNEDNKNKVLEVNRTIEEKIYREEEVPVNAEEGQNKFPQEMVIVENKQTNIKGHLSKDSKRPDTQKQHKIGLNITAISNESEVARKDTCPKLSKTTEKLATETKIKPDLYEIPHEVQNQEEEPSTSKSIKIFDIVSDTPDEHECPKSPTTLIEIEKKTIESRKVQSNIEERQSPPRVDANDHPKLKKVSMDIQTSGEPSSVESQRSEKQRNPKDGLLDEHKPLTKVNESKHDKDFQLDEPEIIPESTEINSCDIIKTSEIKMSNSLVQVESQVSEGKSTSSVELYEHPKLSETSRGTEINEKSNRNLFVKQPRTPSDNVKTPDTSMDTENSNAASSTTHKDETKISEIQSIPKTDLFEELKSSKPELKVNECLPKTKEPPKVVPQFEDLMFDLDHIESPSFSPICESSRISNDSDGFEEFDEDFTSAIIDTVTEAENNAEQTLENSLNYSVADESQNNSKSTKEIKSSSLVDKKSDKESPSKSPEIPNSTEGPKSDAIKESPALKTSCFVTEDIVKTTDSELIDTKISSLDSSILAKKSSDDAKQIEQPKPDEQSSVVSAPILDNRSDKEKESTLFSTVIEKKSPDNSKLLEEPKSDKAAPVSALKSPDLAEKSPNHSKSDKEKESTLLISTVIEQKSPDNSKLLKEPKSDKAAPVSALKSPDLAEKSPNHSKSDKEMESTLLISTVIEQKSPDNSKLLEEPKSDKAAPVSALKSPDLAEKSPNHSKSDKEKESTLLISTVIEQKSPDNSKLLKEPKSDKAAPVSALKSPDLAEKSPNHSKSAKELKSDKIKQSTTEQNKKELTKNKAKNPFKIQKPKKNEEESRNKLQIDFLGFNEKEIEEGQQSTSLRLSQSEDVEPFNIESPSTSNIKPKNNINESQSISGKKEKQEKQKWEKNSAKSLKNWLSKPVKGGSTDDVCDNKKDIKEQSSSVPPKKRRTKVQNLIEPISLEKNVEHRKEEIADANTTIKSVNEVDMSVIEESSDSLNKKEKPKRGRKPKLKNVETIGDITSSKEDLNLSSKSLSDSRKSLLVDAETSIDEKPKRGRQSKTTNNDEFKTPRSCRRSKVTNQSIKKEPSENLLTPMKGRGNKRKRSMSEENTPTPTEPPIKLARVDGDLLNSGLTQSMRKAGRPKKSTVLDPPNVAKDPVTQSSPKQKKYKDDYEFNPRLLLIRKKEELKSNEPLVDPNLQTEPKSPDDVQCALCMGYAPKKKWIQHVSTHYGIGWIVGRPPPLNIKSRGSILSFLLEFYKVSKVKGLNCRLCNSLRRSALGLLMHLEQCCLTEEEIIDTRVVCEYCKKDYTKASYLIHKRTCAEYFKQILQEAKAETSETTDGPKPDDVLSNTGRLKRKAVIKAETMLKKLDETTEFAPEDFIKHIPSKNIRSMETIKENWLMEINSFGKGFCASKTCSFTAISIDDLIDHYQENICPYFEKAGYFCARCKFYNQNIEVVRSHVIDKHSPKPSRCKDDIDAEIDSSESSDSMLSGEDEGESESGSAEVDENGERKPKRVKKPKSKAKRRPVLSKNPPTKEYKKLLPERSSNIQDIVARFYDKFIETNYSLNPLFTFAKINLTHIEASESYFPKSTDSMKFIHNGFHGFVKKLGESKVNPDQWKQLERLHGLTENREYTIYMGGPVKNIAWVPLDPHPPSNIQYLAVTVRKGLDKFTRFLNQKRSRSLIFILKFDISLPSEIKAEIIYAIAIDEGPIHAIEFLPSGGYSPEMNRLGMLAVGTIETEIKIYSLPLEVEKLDCDLFPIVRLEASIELHLELLDNPSDKTDVYSSQCTCLVWSQTAGHNIIVGSYLNGFVGIWDISDDAGNLNRFDLKESKMFVPVSYFCTSEDRLINLVLHYDMNGPRWLAASNSTRKMMLYDLRDITQPILFRTEVTINIIKCMQWPVAWENILFGLGDAMPSNGCVLNAISPMSIMYSTRRFEKFCSGVTDIHFNIWKNCFAAGSDNGDVQVTPLREAVLDVSQRLKIDEKTISTMDIIALNGEDINQNGIQNSSDGMRVFDKDYKDKYGIVFGSKRKIKGFNKPDYYNTKRNPPLNLQRLMRVSKIKFNPNKNACDVLAIGYDNGILRICIHNWLSKV